MFTKRVLVAGLAAVLVGAGHAAGGIIVEYGFGTVESPSWASSDADANTTASALTEGPGIDGTQHGFSTESVKGELEDGGNPPIAYSATSNNFNTNSSFADGDYLAFSVTAVGSVTDWNQMSVDWFRSDATNYSLRLLTSLTDIDANFVQVGSDTGFGPTDDDAWEAAPTIDLSSLGALGGAETRYFRLLISANNGSFSNKRSLGLDNIKVDGTTVPEPATLALLGLGGLGLLLRRKRR